MSANESRSYQSITKMIAKHDLEALLEAAIDVESGHALWERVQDRLAAPSSASR